MQLCKAACVKGHQRVNDLSSSRAQFGLDQVNHSSNLAMTRIIVHSTLTCYSVAVRDLFVSAGVYTLKNKGISEQKKFGYLTIQMSAGSTKKSNVLLCCRVFGFPSWDLICPPYSYTILI